MSRWRRLIQAFVAGIALGLLVRASLPPDAYRKDLQVEYLTARALRDGIDIFTPVAELSARYFPVATDNFPHASPHPPVMALLGIPLTILSFPVLVLLWLALNVVLLLAIGRWLGISAFGSLALSAWPPLWFLLLIGQYELVILALAMLGWRAAAAGRDWRAGLWLGVAASLKLYPALFLVPFLVRRRVRVAAGTVALMAATQLGNLAVVGPDGLVRYYTKILPQVSAIYVGAVLNSAPYGALLRLFGGARDVAPLIDAPSLVLPLTVAVSCLALFALVKLAPEAAPVAVLVALPGVWYYSVVLALPQLVRVLRAEARYAALPIAAAVSMVPPLVRLLVEWPGSTAPPMALLLALQPAGLVGLLILSLLMPQANEPGNASPAEPACAA